MSSPSNEVLVNDPIIPVRQDLMDGQGAAAGGSATQVQNAPLGTRLRLSDRTYYYAVASASIAGGTVVCSPEASASVMSGILLVAAATVGAKSIGLTSTGVVFTANQYAEGFFGVASGTNGGELYRIKSSIAFTGSTAGAITLYDGLNTAITSGSAFWITPNPFQNVFVGSQALDIPIGVTPTNVTSGGYFWLQTWGIANPLHQSATPAGATLTLGTTGGVSAIATGTLGSTGSLPAVYQGNIGKNTYLAATAAQSNPVFLTILP